MVNSKIFRTFAPQLIQWIMRNGDLSLARSLYKPSPKVEEVSLKLCNLFDTPLNNGIVIKSISFEKDKLKLATLSVKSVVRCDNHLGIEIHWFPRRDISTTQDPYCSVFALRYNSLGKLYREIEKAFLSFQK